MRHLHLFQPSFDVNKASKQGRFSCPPLLYVSLVLCLLLVACGGEATADREATVDALGRAVVLTATAAADEDVSSQDLQATAEAAATEAVSTIVAVSAEATEAAVTATAEADAQPPTPPPAPPPTGPGELSPDEIGAELVLYGVDPEAADLVWLQPDVVLAGAGLQRFQPGGPVAAVPLADFVLAADISRQNEGSACGFSLRADDLSQISAQHLLLIGLGPLRLETWQDGDLSPDGFRGVTFTEASNDPQFSLEPGAVNRLAVVARGETFTVYSNGVEVMAVNPLTQFEAGLVALAVFSEEGVGACHFTNSGLWMLR
jgi:hypothetical protein